MTAKRLSLASLGVLLLALVLPSCSAKKERITELYYPVRRQAAPEPVYSRVTWAHLPNPVPPKRKIYSPYIMPTLSFNLKNSNLSEAIEALSQTIGYGIRSQKTLAKRKVSVEMVDTVDKILIEIARQARVEAELDHSARVIRVYDKKISPKLSKKS